jgi:hypothetical protein
VVENRRITLVEDDMPVSPATQQAIDQALADRDAARQADQQHVQALSQMERAEADEKGAAQHSITAHKTALASMDAAVTALRAELDTPTPPPPTPPTPPTAPPPS